MEKEEGKKVEREGEKKEGRDERRSEEGEERERTCFSSWVFGILLACVKPYSREIRF